MGRRTISELEIAQVLGFWRNGVPQMTIARVTGLDRKTIRKLIRQAPELGVSLAPEEPVSGALTEALKLPAAPRIGPSTRLLMGYHRFLAEWAEIPGLSILEMHRRLRELDPDMTVGYTCLRDYVLANFDRPWSRHKPQDS